MQIPTEILSEKNYEGSRLVEITNDDIFTLHEELSDLQKEINPVLDRLSKEYYPLLDPMYAELQELALKQKEIKEKITEASIKFQDDVSLIEATEQKASLVKNKLQPMILDAVKDQLGEFEIARQTINKDGKIYVEVFDEIEEKVKAVRALKAKNG